jgi:hypothetical protein
MTSRSLSKIVILESFQKKSKIKIIEEKTKAEYTKKWGRHKVYYKVILVEDKETSESDLSDIIMKKITTIREGK